MPAGTLDPPVEQGPKEMRLRITAFPATAKLYLDDKLLPSNPFSKSVVADGSKHELRAEAKDYKSEERELIFDQDADLVITLAEEETKSDTQKTTKRWTSPATGSPSKPSAPKPDCNPPFYIDARGIKKFKPKCR
jgi:serine/threonine-protein kinase